MSKFNQTATIKTTNKGGHVAYSMPNKSKLITQVLTSFFNEKKFYGDNSKEMQETIKAVIDKEPQFVSNLAVFARRVFNMRSVSHVLTAYLAHETSGKPYVRRTVEGVTLRGDDLTEIMAFYLATFGKPIPNSLRRAIADKLVSFDEYTLAKYKGDNKAVKMRDLICLCRPTPKDETQSEIFKKCLENRLETPLTWESELSANGNTAETWEKLINSGKVGYMALLRNLRNIIKANPSNIQQVYDIIQDPERVRKSKQLPFRFYSAYKAVSDIAGSKVFDILENALESSVENMSKLPGTTVIAVDTSGSMSSFVSAKSEIRCCEIGMMLGLLANRICENSIFYTFNNDIEKQSLSKRTGILYAATHISRACGGTNMFLPFQKMIDDKVKTDRIIIISDNECNANPSWYRNRTVQSIADEYRRISGNDIWVHGIDLQGYGTQQFHGKKTNIIAGWSEEVLDFILLAEQGEDTLIQRISNYHW
jgi:hypothetical protein